MKFKKLHFLVVVSLTGFAFWIQNRGIHKKMSKDVKSKIILSDTLLRHIFQFRNDLTHASFTADKVVLDI